MSPRPSKPEPLFALVAEYEGAVVGLAHYLFHRSMTRVENICYLSDLFTQPSERGRGVDGGHEQQQIGLGGVAAAVVVEQQAAQLDEQTDPQDIGRPGTEKPRRCGQALSRNHGDSIRYLFPVRTAPPRQTADRRNGEVRAQLRREKWPLRSGCA